MTQRSILAGQSPTVIVRAHSNVSVEGWDSDRISADSYSRWGLRIERRSEPEFARIRAKVGEHVLLDVRVDPIGRLQKNAGEKAIEISLGASGKVQVPFDSRVKIYAGKSVDVHDLRGEVTVSAGHDVRIRNVGTLVHLSAGRAVDFECETVKGTNVKFEAGRDLRCYIRGLTSARFMVDDLGGYWEGVIGEGRTRIQLKCGGDATLVTDQTVIGQPPYDLLGKIERPDAAQSTNS